MLKYFITLAPLIVSFSGTVVTLKYLIPVLKSKKMGQKILDIGPRWHKDKEGTPTMGGISFMIFITVSSLAVILPTYLTGNTDKSSFYGILSVLIYAVVNGIIGVTDDMKKLKKQKNEGLTAKEKYLLQLIAAAFFIFALVKLSVVSIELYLPFIRKAFDINLFWYPFAILFLTGFGNAVNLTDGLDGLCGSVSASVSVFFIAYTLFTENFGMAALSSALFGGCLGFLVYNLHPAKVFMGDTGSLFLGALISGMALVIGKPLLLFTVGIVYLLEAVSVIIQVTVFKLTGKRVFLMAPLHHHFEKKGMSEGKITFAMVILTLVSSVITFLFV